MCQMANAILDNETGELLKYRHLVQRENYRDTWHTSFANEIGRLVQGMGNKIKGTDTIFFTEIKYQKIGGRM